VRRAILSQRALNRALLARQLLLERSTLSVEAAVEQVGGLQTPRHPATSGCGLASGTSAATIRLGPSTTARSSLRAGRIVVDPFEALAASVRRAVDDEREALEAFHR